MRVETGVLCGVGKSLAWVGVGDGVSAVWLDVTPGVWVVATLAGMDIAVSLDSGWKGVSVTGMPGVEVTDGDDRRSFGSWQADKTIKAEQRTIRFRNRIGLGLANEWFDQEASSHPEAVPIAEEETGGP